MIETQPVTAPGAPRARWASLDRLPAWARTPLAADLAFVIAVAVLALVLRTVNLSDYPNGLHGDEAGTGLDARRIVDGEDLWPFTRTALGQPSGPMYWTAPFVKVLGSTILAIRLPMAIVGTATVVLFFLTLRELFGRPAAYIGAVLIACSSWLIFYNRTGYTVSFMPLTELAALLAVAVALRTRRWFSFILAGAVVGAGIYGYFSYPLFAVGLGAYVLIHAAVVRPRPFSLHARHVAVMGLTALLVTQSMWPYLTSDELYNSYRNGRKSFAVSDSAEYKEESSRAGKLMLYVDNAGDLGRAVAFKDLPDASDGSGDRPALDALAVALIAGGGVACLLLAVQRRQVAYLVPLIIVPFVLIGPIATVGGYHRRSLGILPFLLMAAAVGLAYARDVIAENWARMQWAATAAVAVVLVAYGAINVQRYFFAIDDTTNMRFTYAPELTAAAKFIGDQPPDTHIYFLASRWGAGYETIRYLAPDHQLGDGTIEDRSERFSKGETGYANIDRSRDAVIVLLESYVKEADAVAAMYPEARAVESATRTADGPLFVAFLVPRQQ